MLGRYLIFDEIGGGGMAKVHLGRALGAAGFSRVVAIKRVHAAKADDVDYATMLLDEARLAARIRHPNVVPTLDVVQIGGELILVMDYVHGPSLAWLMRVLEKRKERAPIPIVARMIVDALAGLHAAHQAKSERGRPLEMVHRDVSPHNVLISDDGAARIADFGIAKADGKLSMTLHGEVKGKLAYMSPEQLRGGAVDRRADVFGAGIVLWEMLTGRRLFSIPPNGHVANVVEEILTAAVLPPSRYAAVPAAVDAVVMTALRADAADRFPTAEAMASALEAACVVASPKEVAAWVAVVAAELLEKRAALVAEIEQTSAVFDAGALGGKASAEAESTVTVPPATELPQAREEPPPPAEPRRGHALVIMVAIALAAGAMVLVALLRRSPDPTTASSLDAATATITTTAATATTAARTPFPPDADVTPDPVVPAPSHTAAPIGSPPSRRRQPRPAAPDCDPPYAIDPQGVRIPRRECLNP